MKMKYSRYGNNWAYQVGYEPTLVKLEFNKVDHIRRFLKQNDRLFKSNGCYHLIIEIKKIKHFSIIAKIKKISLREYNLKKLEI